MPTIPFHCPSTKEPNCPLTVILYLKMVVAQNSYSYLSSRIRSVKYSVVWMSSANPLGGDISLNFVKISLKNIGDFHKLYENANSGIFVFTAWKQKIQ